MSEITSTVVANASPLSGSAGFAAVGATSAAEAQATQAAAVLKKVHEVFTSIFSLLSAEGEKIERKLDAKQKAINELERLRTGLSSWNEPVRPLDIEQLQKTDALALMGVIIPGALYDKCAYKASPDGNVLFADFPPPVYEDYIKDGTKPNDGQLFYSEKDSAYKLYGNGKLNDVYSQLGYEEVDDPNVDFSTKDVGIIIFVKPTGKYYRVLNDGTGAEVTDYPLQKFVYNLSERGKSELSDAIDNKLSDIRSLSNKDLLDAQRVTGQAQALATVCINLLSAVTAAFNFTSRNII